MKSGTIRRIDELGRIVIPKDIRTALRIKSGDNLEIFIENNQVILKKYSEISKTKEIGTIIINLIKEILNSEIIITDKDKIILDSSNKYIGQELNEEIIKIMNNRQMILKQSDNLKLTTNEIIEDNFIINPIIVNGDINGCIIVISKGPISKEEIDKVVLITNFLIKYIE